MISTTAKYALRAVVYLAGQNGGYISRKDIAKASVVPLDYLLKVLSALDEAGIVESRRGPGGGYRLTEKPTNITAFQVVTAVDTIPRISQCPLGVSTHRDLCPLHHLLDEASRLVEEAFRNATVADLVPGGDSQSQGHRSCQFPNPNPNKD